MNRSTPAASPSEEARDEASEEVSQEPGRVQPLPPSRRGPGDVSGRLLQSADSGQHANMPPDDADKGVLATVADEMLTTADILRGLIIRTRLPWLLRHHQRRVVLAVFSVLMGAISLAIISVVALLTHSPFVFPSLGPAAYLFFYRPGSAAASPRNALTGCAIGILAGYVALLVTGLVGAPPAALEGITWPRVLAVALAFSLTTVLLILLDVTHPPALATTLVVALGAFAQPLSLLTLYGGIVLLTAEAFLINRAAGLPYPLWRARPLAFQRRLDGGLARSAYTTPAPPDGPLEDV